MSTPTGERPMQTAKQLAMETIATLPEDADLDEIMYRLYVLENIRKGREDVAQGRVTDAEELRREIDSW